MSGMDYLLAIKEGKIPPPPILDALGFEGFELHEGRVIFGFMPQEYHYNLIAVVHGGVTTTLLDSAMGCAVGSILPAGAHWTTLDLNVGFFRPLTIETGRVQCEGWVVHAGRNIARAEAKVTDGAGKLYARATSTCLLTRPGA